MTPLRRAVCILAVAAAAAGFASPASALEMRVTELRVAGGSIRASIEIKDMFPEKFQSILEGGGAIHLRLQLELWEDRAVWDKLAQPAVVTVFRIDMDASTRQVRVADQYGEVSRQPAWQEPLTLRLDLGRADALSDSGQYYVRAQATLGTIAEKESERASNTVFGEDDSTLSIAGMGKRLFHAVLQVNDYLQSVSSEMRTHTVNGRAVKTGVKLQ